MKRTKFIAAAMVLSLGLLGTGYAYWTDSLQVNTTVETGKFNLEFDPLYTANYTYDSEGNCVDAEYVKSRITMDKNHQAMNLKVDNMYPGSTVHFYYNVTNESTIPMILDSSTVTGVDDADDFLVTWQMLDGEEASPNNYVVADPEQSLGEQLEFVLKTAYKEIEPGKYKDGVSHAIIIEMLGEENVDKTNQGKEFTAKISLDWKQENAN